jgi:hypothetical protein
LINIILEIQMKQIQMKTYGSNSFLSTTDKWAMFLIPLLLFFSLRCTDKFDAHRELCATYLKENKTNLNCWWISPAAFFVSNGVEELKTKYGEKAEHIIVSKKYSKEGEELLFWEIIILENKVIYCKMVDDVYIYDLINPLQK